MEMHLRIIFYSKWGGYQKGKYLCEFRCARRCISECMKDNFRFLGVCGVPLRVNRAFSKIKRLCHHEYNSNFFFCRFFAFNPQNTFTLSNNCKSVNVLFLKINKFLSSIFSSSHTRSLLLHL